MNHEHLRVLLLRDFLRMGWFAPLKMMSLRCTSLQVPSNTSAACCSSSSVPECTSVDAPVTTQTVASDEGASERLYSPLHALVASALVK